MTLPAPLAPPHARIMARAALRVRATDLPAPAIDKAKLCLLDYLSCAFEARELPWSRQALATVRPLPVGAAVIGTSLAATPGDAALANAVLGHGLVREDMHAGSISHHGVVVWPVLLAFAQRQPVSGARFLAAAVVGYEAGARLGQALFTTDLARLFRPTGLVAPVGAAIAGAHLLGLAEDAATSAIAIAANTSSGLNQWPHTGGSEMYFHPGFAARNAIAAVELAEAGAYASPDILEGEAGLFAAFRREPPRHAVELFAGGEPEIMRVYNKPAPACNFAQTACQAALRIAQALGPRSADIAAVAIGVPDAAKRYPGCDFAGPFERALQAKMSIQFCVAATLARGAIEEENYRRLDDPSILRLVAATQLTRDAAFDAVFPAAQGATVEVELSNGDRLSHRLDDVLPASPEEIAVRFRDAATRIVGAARAHEIDSFVSGLALAGDAGQLAALCTLPGAASRRRSGAAGRAAGV